MKPCKTIILLPSMLMQLYICLAQTSSLTNLSEANVLMTITPKDMFINPDQLINAWIDQPVPLSYYSEEEINAQRIINYQTADAIVTYSPQGQKTEFIEIDHEEITPYTWKWVHLDLIQSDGSVTKLSLRRPNWWIEELGATRAGKSVFISMIEMGIQGQAIVTHITACQLDTRLWEENRQGDYVTRPITGKFMGLSSNVFCLKFEGNVDSLEVTGNHPLWSTDQGQWVSVENLHTGEWVKAITGSRKITSRIRKPGMHKVYNIEVFKDHNFFASLNNVLVHNSCLPWDTEWHKVLNSKHKIDRITDWETDGIIIRWHAGKKDNDVARYYISTIDGTPDLEKFIEFFSEQAAGRLQVEVRISNEITSKLKNIPKDGTAIHGFHTSYDAKEGVLQLSKTETRLDDYNGFTTGDN